MSNEIIKIRIKPSGLNSLKYKATGDENLQKRWLKTGTQFDKYLKQAIIPLLPHVYTLNENAIKTIKIENVHYDILGQADGIFVNNLNERIILELKWVDIDYFSNEDEYFNYGWCFQCIAYAALYNADVYLIIFSNNQVLNIRI